ncbi:hypothetical protein GGX14DRAFT_655311 [Mycena pura]|uniref:Uncharacterized protein n=1 Tax=Mycena pura TaxID=153505 RepID=A0AAD6V785_9AGAR|nr:hypothetical protein GGX14DRAFT_655311 [Mycena pura]
MADETEVLDWDEDDAHGFVAEHDEDAVSLGASDEEFDPTPPTLDVAQPPSKTDTAGTPARRHSPSPRHGHSSSRSRGDRDRDRDRERERHRNSRDDRERERDRDTPREREREREKDRDRDRERKPPKTTLAQPITHALPPKPVTAAPVFNQPSSIEATLMAPSNPKDAKDGKPKSVGTPNGSGNSGAYLTNIQTSSTHRDSFKSTAPERDRERERDSRLNERELRQPHHPNNPNASPSSPNASYFHNTQPYKSSWERPGATHAEDRERRNEDDRSHPRGGERGRPYATRGHYRDHRDVDGSPQIQTSKSNSSGGRLDSPHSNPNEDDGLSYRDRHYRPEGAADSATTTLIAPSPGIGNNPDHSTRSLVSRPPLSPPRGGRDRGRESDSGRPPPPNHPNSMLSTPASSSPFPGSHGDFGSKRPLDRVERDRDGKYRDSRDSQAIREQGGRADLDRERERRHVQGPPSDGRAFDNGDQRDRRAYQVTRPDERERRDGRERERDRDRDRRDTEGWLQDRERNLPPHQYETRKQEYVYEPRKPEDPPYSRDAQTRNNGHGNPNVAQNQIHAREREPILRESLAREPPMHRDSSRHHERDSQPFRSANSMSMLSVPPRHVSHRSRSTSPPGIPQQRKREKTRFAPSAEGAGDTSSLETRSPSTLGQPLPVTGAVSSGPVPTQTTASLQIAVAFGLVDRNEDAYVPDEFLEEREVTKLAPEKGLSKELLERTQDVEDRERPKRPPLPSQDKIFQDLETGRYQSSSAGPTSAIYKPLLPPSMPPFPPSMPPMSARLSGDPPHGPRDAISPTAQRLPSGPRQSRVLGQDGRSNYPPSLTMQIDTDMIPPRDTLPASQSPSAVQAPPPSHGPPAGPAAPIRAGSGMYADREALATPVSASGDGGSLPRGPRAMTVPTPTGPYGYGVGPPGVYEGGHTRGRGRDRSPPPHLGGDRIPRGGSSDGYRGRGRGYLPSGTNIVPIGTRQQPPVDSEGRYFSSAGPSMGGFAGDQGFSDNGYRGRVRGRGRGRGRGQDFGPTGYNRESYNGPDTVPGRYGTPPLERNTSPYSRTNDHYEESSRYEPQAVSHRRSNYPDNGGYPPPASLSRQSSQATFSNWEYNDARHDRAEIFSRRSDDGPTSMKTVKPERDRYPPENDEPSRPRVSLEDRLAPAPGERYNVSPQESRPTHPLPMNPALRRVTHRNFSPEPRPPQGHVHHEPFHGQQSRDGDRRGPMRQEHEVVPQNENPLVERVGGYDDGPLTRQPRIVRIRRPVPSSSLDNNSALPLDAPSVSAHRTAEDAPFEHAPRPPGPVRNATLLERLSAKERRGDGEGNMGDFEEAPSLRDRVQVPSKRDWEDIGDREASPEFYGRDGYHDGDDDAASKRRRKNGKPKRGRRGGPP